MDLLIDSEFTVLNVVSNRESNNFNRLVSDLVLIFDDSSLLHQIKTLLDHAIGAAIVLGHLFRNSVDLKQLLNSLKCDFFNLNLF